MIYNILLFLTVWAMALPHAVYGIEGRRLDHDCVLYVETGDSYIGLFGRDWERVFKANREMAFYHENGALKRSPEKLVVGTKLVVPAGTNLTKRALDRLNRYEKIKSAAHRSIREAEAFVSNSSDLGSEVYRQAINLLAKAKAAASSSAYGGANFIEGRRLGLEATRLFKIDGNLRRADRDIQKLKEQVLSDVAGQNNEISKLYRQRKVFGGLVAIMLFSFLWYIRIRKKKERRIRIKGWLDKHLGRVQRLEEVKI